MAAQIKLRYDATCADCGAALPAGTLAKWYGRGRIYGRGCHERSDGNGAGLPARRVLTGDLVSKLESALEAADEAARKAADEFAERYYKQPAFAVVENARGDFASDPSKPPRVVGLMADVCGFVWLEVSHKRGAQLLADFKRAGKLAERQGTRKEWKLGRFRLSYAGASHSRWSSPWHLYCPSVGYGNGAMSAQEAAGRAFASAMLAAGYDGVSMCSRID